MVTRRQILTAAGLCGSALAMPSITFGMAATDRRFVLVILRGAVDGLALAAPYGDGSYPRVRGELAMSPGDGDRGLLSLDGLFGLHPALAGLHANYRNGDALIVHAIASPYRDRSHFDGQDVLEQGGAGVGALRDGWLNRALAPLDGAFGYERAIAMARNTPLVLRGDNSVTSWAPSRLPATDDATLERLQDLYADDDFFATRLARALQAQKVAGAAPGMTPRPRGGDAEQLREMFAAAARFLTADAGPQIAVIEAGGWDTHANQGAGTGALANRFAALDAALGALEAGMADTWNDVVVAVVTEFGRTVSANGTRGTDHGTATAALLLGGAVEGGRVLADWPGLRPNDLYEGRDLRPTTDLRSLFKGILAEHLLLPVAYLEKTVFPHSSTAQPLLGLVRG